MPISENQRKINLLKSWFETSVPRPIRMQHLPLAYNIFNIYSSI